MSYENKVDNNYEILVRKILRSRIADLIFAPFYGIATIIGLTFRKIGIQFLPISRSLAEKIGGQFVLTGYYDPLPRKKISQTPSKIGYNSVENQIELYNEMSKLNDLNYFQLEELINEKLIDVIDKFNLFNSTFHTLDAFIYLKFLIANKPKNILEIGSGNSTKIALCYKRIMESRNFNVNITCIEPFEVNWLENVQGINLIRKKVEDTDIVNDAKKFDLLFVDSSHVVKIGGDIEYIYTQIIPSLGKDSFIHIHDIFSPEVFPEKWRYDSMRLWAEQVLVDSLVASNALQHLFSLSSLSLKYKELNNLTSENYFPSSAYFKKNN